MQRCMYLDSIWCINKLVNLVIQMRVVSHSNSVKKFTLLECVYLCNEYRMKLDECLIKQRYACFLNKYKENISKHSFDFS